MTPGRQPCRRRPAGRARLRRADRLRPARRGRPAGARPSAAAPRWPAWRRPRSPTTCRLTERLTELGRRPGRGDGAVRLRARRLPREHPARAPGSRAWSRPTSATGWPPTSTARSPRSCPTPTGRWCSRCSPTPGTPTSPSARCGRRSPPTAGSPGRLSLWGRRLVGEAMTQSQAVIAEHDRLAELIITGTGDLAGVGRLIERITSAHTERMKALGLNPHDTAILRIAPRPGAVPHA